MTQSPTSTRGEPSGRHAWTDANELLAQAEAKQPLAGAELEALAEAALFAPITIATLDWR